LNCGMHFCQAQCHEGSCGECEIVESQCKLIFLIENLNHSTLCSAPFLILQRCK